MDPSTPNDPAQATPGKPPAHPNDSMACVRAVPGATRPEAAAPPDNLPNPADVMHMEYSTDGSNFSEYGTTYAYYHDGYVGGLSQGQTYYFRVWASNSGGSSGYSNVYMINGVQPPQVPFRHTWLRSFWPGSSSAPCTSTKHCARSGAAASATTHASAAAMTRAARTWRPTVGEATPPDIDLQRFIVASLRVRAVTSPG